MGKSILKNINKNLSGKYSQKLLDHTKKSATDAVKTSLKRVIKKIAEATSYLTGNKITEQILKVSKISRQNNSEIVTNEDDKEIPKEKYISPEKRQEITDALRLKQYNYGISKEITKVSKNSQQNNTEAVTNENDKEIPKERHISPEERQKFFYNLDNYL